MSKKITTLYLDKALVEEAKKRRINLSELFNEFLAEYLADDELKKLEEIEREMEELERRLAKLRAMREAILRRREQKLKRRGMIDRAMNLVKRLIELNERAKVVRTIAEAETISKETKKLSAQLKSELGLVDGDEKTISLFRAINKGDISAARKIVEEVVK